MKKSTLAAVLCLLIGPSTAHAQVGTAFTYQGRLTDAAAPANGAYDFELQLFTLASGGTGSTTQTLGDVTVADGLFTVKLDFGAEFTGSPRWLEIRVRPGVSTGPYTALTPRQELTPSPNAVFAASSATVAASGVNTAQIADGAVTSLKLGPGAVTAGAIASGQVVKSLNGLADTVTIAGSGGATVSTVGSTITVAAAPPTPPLPPGAVVLGVSGDTTLIGAGYTELPVGNQQLWAPTSTAANVPSARSGHTAVWTGSKMIVWGGGGLDTGGQYDPATDSWTPTTTTGAPSGRSNHTAVWTGSRMIVWGGVFDTTGGQYDPTADSWTPTATTDAPSERSYHTAVWTGAKMIIWGGSGFGATETGGVYTPGDPGSWTPTTTTGAPSPRYLHTAVWTGSKMIIWGGFAGSRFNTGGQYDPGADSWTDTALVGAPTARNNHTAVWTGSKMIVWGGEQPLPANTGAEYTPGGPPGDLGSWASTTTAGAPTARAYHTAVWTGSKMVVWGGNSGNGGLYDPTANSWTPTGITGAPSLRSFHTAVWTGSRMIIWGSSGDSTGGQWFGLSYFIKN